MRAREWRRRIGGDGQVCGQTYDASVAAGADDGFVRTIKSPQFVNNSNIVAGHTAAGGVFDLWCRFDGITIPAGATIEDVYLTFQAWTSSLDGVGTVTNIHCEAADDPVAPVDKADIDGRTRTTNFTAWDDYDFPDTTNDYDTPSFVSALQEVVDRGGWASGQAIMVIIDDDGSSAKVYSLRSMDQGSGPNAPDIHIQYCA